MKTVSASYRTWMQGASTTKATLWKLTRVDGTVMGFTDHDQDIVFDGLTYEAATGYTRSAVASNSNLAVNNLEVSGVLTSDSISDTDLRAGLYDFADVLIQEVNWSDLTMGSLKVARGKIGQVTLKDIGFVAELLGLEKLLNRNIIGVYTVTCTADLGDARCTKDLTGLGETGTVTAITDARRKFTATITGTRDAGWFDAGELIWSTGNNADLSREVKSVSGTTVTLFFPTSFDIQVGDTFAINPGCNHDGTPTGDCKVKFDNLVNFRGFGLFIPGRDAALAAPDAI